MSALSSHIEDAIREMFGAPDTAQVYVEMYCHTEECEMCGVHEDHVFNVSAHDYANRKRNKPAPSWHREFKTVTDMLSAIFPFPEEPE